jgi:hypothetical protein
MTSTRIHRQCGQAALESVALVVLVALLLGVTAAWAVRVVPGGAGPPPVIERAARPLAPAPPAVAVPPVAPAPADGDDGGAWRRILRGGRAVLVLRMQMEERFARGFLGRVRDRAAAVLRAPSSVVPRSPTALIPDPVQSVRAALDGVRDGRRYVARLRRMPRREAVLQVTEDVGALTADQLIDLATRRLLRRAAGAAAGAGRGRGPAPAGATVAP